MLTLQQLCHCTLANDINMMSAQLRSISRPRCFHDVTSGGAAVEIPALAGKGPAHHVVCKKFQRSMEPGNRRCAHTRKSWSGCLHLVLDHLDIFNITSCMLMRHLKLTITSFPSSLDDLASDRFKTAQVNVQESVTPRNNKGYGFHAS